MAGQSDSGGRAQFARCLMTVVKCNLGLGILAVPAGFKHCGLAGGVLAYPCLCLLATHCMHLLVRSSRRLESELKSEHVEYAELARGAFRIGPAALRPHAAAIHTLVAATLVVCQLGICCVYLVFIVDNIASILATYGIDAHKNHLFLGVLPPALLLSYIRTLDRLAIASACANLLQVAGLCLVVECLLRGMPREPQVEYFRWGPELALGFGSAMFAFEGISVVLPVYAQMKRREQMSSPLGIINLSFAILLLLNMLVGVLGYLRFGASVADSVTLNLPRVLLYDIVRGMFTVSLLLGYPLQFYVPHAILWGYAAPRLAQLGRRTGKPPAGRAPAAGEYLFRALLVLATFALAASVPKLNLMIDLFGSITGTSLTVTLPALIHLAAFWRAGSGVARALTIGADAAVVVFGLAASANGAYFSLAAIMESFGQ